jgi:cellulose synthase (UDP-forming)
MDRKMAPLQRQSSGEFLLTGVSLPFVSLTAVFIGAAALFFSDMLTLSRVRQEPLASVLVLAIAGVLVANSLIRWGLLLRMKRPLPRTPRRDWRACVVTTFVPGSEPVAMIERTLAALVGLHQPHDTWLLDEGDDAEVKRLCVRLGVLHFSRRHTPKYQTAAGVFEAGSKHGNYNAWLTDIGFDRYDCMTAFDADHMPEPGFLDEVLGYFEDPVIGYVQAPQAYYNQRASFIAAGAAEETYDFNSTIQMASYGMGYPVVIGCHNSHRMTALRDVGGFAAHDADDLLITIHYRRRGWQGVYVPRILARGLAPVDWHGYLTQQRRWARSVLDLKFRSRARLAAETPRLTRLMSALYGLNYLQPAFLLAGGLWLLLGMLATGTFPAVVAAASPDRAALLIGAMSACHFYRQRFFLDPAREGGVHWRARIMRLAKSPFLLLAVADVIVGQERAYEITAKVKSTSSRMLCVAFAPIAALIATAWTIGAGFTDVYPIACHVCGAVTLSLCLGLMATDFLPVPAPFDARLIPVPG